MKDLKNYADALAEDLNLNFNIRTVQTFNKGERALFKKIPEDTIVLTHYFGSDGWNSGVQLMFHKIGDNLIFKGRGVFGFRDDKYDTPENNKILDEIVEFASKYSFTL